LAALPPLLSSRPPALRVLLAGVAPVVFGVICGLVLEPSPTVYLLLQVPAILGGLGAGLEHATPREGALRGLLGGLLFGSAVVLGYELGGGGEDHDLLPDPPIALVVITVSLGALFGWLGARFRQRRAG
jgi:hypothetical protein